MDHREVILPENADKVLFAEDLVSFVMTHIFFAPYEGTQATPYRDLIHNAFNGTIEVAIEDTANRLLRENYSFYSQFQNMDEPVEIHYLQMIDYLKLTFCSSDGFDPKLFLLYCANVSIIGGFLRSNGLEKSPDMAVSAIIEYIMDYDMLSTGWNTLTVCASTLETLKADSNNILTPVSLSPDFSSPDPSSTDSASPSSSETGQEHYTSNSLNEKDDDPRNKTDDVMDTEESSLTDSSKEPILLDENRFTEDLESSCMSTRREYLQPKNNFEMALKDESTNQMTLTSSIDYLFAAEDVEHKNNLISPVSVEDKVLKTIKDIVEENIGTSVANGANVEGLHGKDFVMKQKSAIVKGDVSKLYASNDREMLSKDNCLVVKHEDYSKSPRPQELLSSLPELGIDKT